MALREEFKTISYCCYRVLFNFLNLFFVPFFSAISLILLKLN